MGKMGDRTALTWLPLGPGFTTIFSAAWRIMVLCSMTRLGLQADLGFGFLCDSLLFAYV